MKILAATAAAMALMLSASGAGAATLYDSGTPDGGGRYGIGSGQFMAGHFVLGSAGTITGIEAFLGTHALTQPGSILTVAIRGEAQKPAGFELPGEEIYSHVIVAGDPGSTEWRGALDLDWQLVAGSYWVTFELRSGQDFSGYMLAGANNPLALYAFSNPIGEWTQQGFDADSAPGIRLHGVGGDFSLGNPSAAPEPTTWAMMIVGFGVVGGAIRRKSALPIGV